MNFAFRSLRRMSCIFGKGYAPGSATALTLCMSEQNLREPSLFRVNTIELEQPLCDGSMILCRNISCTCLRISSCTLLDIG